MEKLMEKQIIVLMQIKSTGDKIEFHPSLSLDEIKNQNPDLLILISCFEGNLFIWQKNHTECYAMLKEYEDAMQKIAGRVYITRIKGNNNPKQKIERLLSVVENGKAQNCVFPPFGEAKDYVVYDDFTEEISPDGEYFTAIGL